MPGFSGVSQGWEFVVMARADVGERIQLGVVQTTFQVRNGIPVAEDDAVTIAARPGGIVVGADQGLLANDRDPNGDVLIVPSAGVASYPWGTVGIHHDGSYRVTVTDPDVAGTAEVRYVVWDGKGSTAGSDTGILTVTFDEATIASDELLCVSGVEGGCGAAWPRTTRDAGSRPGHR